MMHLDSNRQVAAARFSPTSDVLTILYADGGAPSATQTDPDTANEIVTELGLMRGGNSHDGVRHWWR
jgi:hypothetical protein